MPVRGFATGLTEEDAGRITTVEAATERVGLLERHLERCRRLRLEHLGGS